MRLAEKIERQGEFWISEDKSKTYFGTLYIGDGGECKLKLLNFRDPFSDQEWLEFNLNGSVDGIGICVFEECSVNETNMNTAGTNTTVVARFAHLGTLNYSAIYDRFTVSFENINEWANGESVKFEGGKQATEQKITYSVKQPITIRQSPEISLVFEWLRRSNKSEFVVRFSAYLSVIQSNSVSVHEVNKEINMLRHYFSFLAGQVFNLGDLYGYSGEEKAQIIYRSNPINTSVKPLFRTALISSEHIYPEIQDSYSKWRDIFEVAWPALSNYFSTKLENDYINQKILKLAFGLESFHSRVFPEYKVPEVEKLPKQGKKVFFMNRVNDLMGFVADDISFYSEFARELKDYRNAESHLNESVETYREDSTMLVKLYYSVDVLFTSVIAKKILSSENYQRLVKSSEMVRKFKAIESL